MFDSVILVSTNLQYDTTTYVQIKYQGSERINSISRLSWLNDDTSDNGDDSNDGNEMIYPTTKYCRMDVLLEYVGEREAIIERLLRLLLTPPL